MSGTILAELPAPFRELLAALLPAERLPAVLASFAIERPTAFRLNPLKGEPTATLAELAAAGLAPQAIAWYPLAYTVPIEQHRLLTDSPAARDGRLYIQGLSSMLAPLALAPEPGETVLDMAAAPGGKTLLLAVLMANQGQLSAVEAVRDRFFRLRGNLQNGGVTCVRTFLIDGRAVGRKCPERFDRVLLDAPCSSEARFDRRDPSSWAHWSPRKVAEAARKQHGLLRSAWQSLRPGGRLLYCTCSFSPEENELVVDGLLRSAGDAARVLPLQFPLENLQPGLTAWQGKSLAPELAHAVRVLPDAAMDGFFLCLLEKSA